MQDEAAARGDEFVYDPGTNLDVGEQATRMQALIDQKVDVIFLAPHDETVLAPKVVAARKACIPVFVEDRAVDPVIAVPGVDYVTNMGSDFKKEGELAADWLIKATGGKAKIIEIEGTVGSSPGVQRKQGFDALIAEQPGMSILVSESANFNRATGHDVALRLLQENPTADVVYSHNDEMSLGVIAAMEELGKVPGKDLMIVSIDGEKEAIQAILDGKIAVVVECNPKFGPLSFATMEKYAAGEQIPLNLKNTDRVFDLTNAADYLPEAF